MAIKFRTWASVSLLAATLSACYVVPVDPRTGGPAYPNTQTNSPQPAPGPVNFPARLYPANDLASRYGMVQANVTNDLNGRGTFNVTINGEAFTGEATRQAGSNRNGVANGVGQRGAFINCQYTMNNSTQGTGKCTMSDGAVFNMHLGN